MVQLVPIGRYALVVLMTLAVLMAMHPFILFVMIGNAGLMTGVTGEDILALFQPFGPIDDVIMVPCKSFCFVKFANVADAACSMQSIHGKPLAGIDKPIYLAFVSNIPSLSGCAASNHFPPGLILVREAITEAEEELLLDVQFDTSGSSMKNRDVKHYGYEFLYETNNVARDGRPCEPIPPLCRDILIGFAKCHYVSHIPDQLTVNRYQPGQGIPLHVDTHSAFEDEILSLSLGSPLVMEFRHPDGMQHGVLLPRRSLLVMSKESRYLWSHGITPRKTDVVRDPSREDGCSILYRGVRTSYTFRKVRHDPCKCQFSERCDSQNCTNPRDDAPKLPESDHEAKRLEIKHVHEVYEEIAEHFSNTRHTPWPRVTGFLQSLFPGTLLLDLGCGNGKYLGINPLAFKVGCDYSSKLMSICGQRGMQGFCGDATSLPLRSGAFDACLCIAVIHHLATVERRARAIQEIARILRPGGLALVYVWALEQKIDSEESHYISSSPHERKNDRPPNTDFPQTIEALPVHTNRTQFAHRDLFVPWHLKSASQGVQRNDGGAPKILHRYYHVFQKGELEELCDLVKDVSVNDSYYDNGNWCVILEKRNAS